MENRKFLSKRLNKGIVGDTIIEVLIAIGVAAFAIGTSYAIASKSLQHAIEARERNQSITIIQNQITDLKIRAKADKSFLSIFAIPGGQPPKIYGHYCLDDSAKGPSDPNWAPLPNDFLTDESRSGNLAVSGLGGYYNPKCKIASSSTDFFVDITKMITVKSVNSIEPTIFRFTVKWSAPGGGNTLSAVAYYRLDSHYVLSINSTYGLVPLSNIEDPGLLGSVLALDRRNNYV